MDLKLVCLVIFLLGLTFIEIGAEFFYNPIPPTEEQLHERGLKCIPGRTVMKLEHPSTEHNKTHSEEEDEIHKSGRRTHMMTQTSDESCQICICSAEGKDEYCSKRPAKNVNECMRMATLTDEFHRNIPFDHERSLSFRIRRLGDYLWHNDEIPYNPDAKCKRGFSYYTGHKSPENTDLEAAADIDSLLDYEGTDTCHYCVCSVDGMSVGCLKREQWACEFFKQSRDSEAYSRDRYANLFKQDRPRYFRQLSYRIRRTMDAGMIDFVEIGGDTLCCNHPNGHRRKLQAEVHNRVRQLRRKVPRENLLSGGPNGDYVDFIVNNDK